MSETDEHIHANSLPFDCIKNAYTYAYTHTGRHLFPGAAGRIWSLFKSLNYSWLKIHGEPFIWKLGAVQAALWCLIGLKVANPLNKSGRGVMAACVHRMRMGVFTTHYLSFSPSSSLSLSLSFSLSCFCVLYMNLRKKQGQASCETDYTVLFINCDSQFCPLFGTLNRLSLCWYSFYILNSLFIF